MGKHFPDNILLKNKRSVRQISCWLCGLFLYLYLIFFFQKLCGVFPFWFAQYVINFLYMQFPQHQEMLIVDASIRSLGMGI